MTVLMHTLAFVGAACLLSSVGLVALVAAGAITERRNRRRDRIRRGRRAGYIGGPRC